MNIKINKCLNCGTAHDWPYDQPTLRELRRIKARTAMNSREYGEGLTGGDPEATTALIDLLHRREGIELRWDDIDLDFDDFDIVPTAMEEAAANSESGKGDEAEPPIPNGETPAAD